MAVLDEVLDRAHRRHLLNVALQALAAGTIAAGVGFLLLLLMGTDVLVWYAPLLLGLIGAAAGWWRGRKTLLTPYRLAQLIDARLSLQDRLSTLFYFERIKPTEHASLDIIRTQTLSAVQPSDADRAIPIAWPRTSYAAGAVLLLCVITAGLRFGLMRTLDLRRPVAEVAWTPFATTPEVQAATARKSLIQEHIEQQLEKMGLTPEEIEQQTREADAQPEQDTESTTPTPDGISLPGDKGQSTGEKGQQLSEESGEESDQSSGEAAPDQNGNPDSPSVAAAKPSPQAGAKNAKPTSAPKESKLTDRLKDALAGLMNKLGMDGEDKGQGEEQQSSSKTDEQSGRQSQASRGMQSQGKSQSQNQQPSPDSQESREGGSEPAPGMQSRAADKGAERSANPDAKSGTGRQDGDKAIREAEQLAAMGKIAEIFGKRASQVTGEVTVEVPGGKQQLRTNYSQQQTRSTGYAAEVNRDEIPLMYQSYIQRYFEELRKSPAPKTKAAPKSVSKDNLSRTQGPQPTGATP